MLKVIVQVENYHEEIILHRIRLHICLRIRIPIRIVLDA